MLLSWSYPPLGVSLSSFAGILVFSERPYRSGTTHPLTGAGLRHCHRPASQRTALESPEYGPGSTHSPGATPPSLPTRIPSDDCTAQCVRAGPGARGWQSGPRPGVYIVRPRLHRVVFVDVGPRGLQDLGVHVRWPAQLSGISPRRQLRRGFRRLRAGRDG